MVGYQRKAKLIISYFSFSLAELHIFCWGFFMVSQSRIALFSRGSPSKFVGFLLVMTRNPCKLCGVNNASRSFHQNNTQSLFGGLNKWAVVFSLGLSGTRRPNSTRSPSLTADVPPWVMVDLIRFDGHGNTHLNRTL